MKILTIESFAKRQISLRFAEIIANDMYDLPAKSKKDLIAILSGKRPGSDYTTDNVADNLRLEKYQKLDATTKFIVELILNEPNYQSAILNFNYVVACLEHTKRTLEEINKFL